LITARTAGQDPPNLKRRRRAESASVGRRHLEGRLSVPTKGGVKKLPNPKADDDGRSAVVERVVHPE
jgi:hypothetical protein